MSICNITLTGRVGNEPEATKKDDNLYASFRIAVNGVSKGEEYTDWHSVTCSDKKAEAVLEHVKKGDKLVILGNPRPHAYFHQETQKIIPSFKIWMNEFDFASSKEKPEVDFSKSTNPADDVPDFEPENPPPVVEAAAQ